MEIRSVGRNSTVYIFDSIESYKTNVFVIECEAKIFLIDTFCGTSSMGLILKRLNYQFAQKEIIVVNTHFHWDHVWGNASFKDHWIISHELCRTLLDELWEDQINDNRKYLSEPAEKCLPNLTFQEKIIFHQEGIELFHSPGHTVDSISLFDHQEGILYTGDNLEKPIIYVENNDIPTYINTLENYLSYKPRKIVSGHTLDLSEEDIHAVIAYLHGLSAGKEMHFVSEYERKIHEQNLRIVHQV